MKESIQADARGAGDDGPRLPAAPTIRIRPGRRASSCFREVWEYRELLYFFIWRDIKVRYKQTAIGAGWAIIQPLFTMVIFSLFFGLLAGIPSEGLPYPVFYYCALLPWMYFAGALNNATNSIVDNQRVITKVYFPRLILPMSAVLSGLLDFAIACLVLVGIMAYYGIRPTPTAWLLPLFILLAMATAFGAGLWSSALNAVYRDVRYAMPFLIQAWMFVSPVAYPSSLVPEGWRWLYGLNPMAGVIEGFRWALTGRGRAPELMLFASSGAVCLLVAGGLFYFRRAERTIADVV
jgi:lipopolysaccharide transport system permease protein